MIGKDQDPFDLTLRKAILHRLKDSIQFLLCQLVCIPPYTFHDRSLEIPGFGTYDIPVKGTDGAWMEGSEEIYDFLVCVLSPLKGEYRFGFLYPAFAGRSADPNKIYVFHENPKQPEMELLSLIGTK